MRGLLGTWRAHHLLRLSCPPVPALPTAPQRSLRAPPPRRRSTSTPSTSPRRAASPQRQPIKSRACARRVPRLGAQGFCSTGRSGAHEAVRGIRATSGQSPATEVRVPGENGPVRTALCWATAGRAPVADRRFTRAGANGAVLAGRYILTIERRLKTEISFDSFLYLLQIITHFNAKKLAQNGYTTQDSQSNSSNLREFI
jgi:hypothetical protein